VLFRSMPEALPKKPWRSSRALRAYASALSLDARALPGRLFRIGPSPLPLSGFESIDERGLEALAGSSASSKPSEEGGLSESHAPPREAREAILRERLAAWRELAADASAAIARGTLPKAPLVSELLRSIDIVDYAAARRAILAEGDPEPAALDMGRRCDQFLSALERRFAP
jgi:hypothetical protein